MKKKQTLQLKSITTVARGVVYFIALGIVTVQTILLPELAREEAAGRANPPITYPFFLGAWILSLPLFIALYQTHNLIRYIDKNMAFSEKSVTALQIIKRCTIAFSIMIALSAITLVVSTHLIDPTEDTPPILMFGTILTLASSIIATFVAVLQRLLKEAIVEKSENDLIV